MSDVSGTRAAPTATGTLASTPFAHVLIYARNKRLSGALRLRAADGGDAIVGFWRGRISLVQTSPATFYLGTILQELGWVDEATLREALRESTQRPQRLGEVLVERGAITSVQRDTALGDQALRRVRHLFSLPTTTAYSFYDEQPSVDQPSVVLETLAPVWLALREQPPARAIEEVLARYAHLPLRMVNEAILHRIALGPAEKDLVAALSTRPLTLAQLRSVSPASAGAVDLLVYFMLVAKCVEPSSTSRSAMPAINAPRSPSLAGLGGSGEVRIGVPTFRIPSAAAAITAPSSPTPAEKISVTSGKTPAELGAEGIVARAGDIEKESYFQRLGVPHGAPSEVVRSSYMRLARVWHPDRLPGDLASVRAHVMTVFTHLTRAHETLTNDDARRGYLATANGRTTKVGARPRNDVIRDIEAALARRDFLGAEIEARKLHDENIDDAEALAFVAWAAALSGHGPDAALRSSLVVLDRAVNADVGCERAYFYRAMIHKRLGHETPALRDFARVLKLNPTRTDAEREVRVLSIRARGSGEFTPAESASKSKK